MKKFLTAKKRTEVPVGESVRILRELQEPSQSQLAALAKALKCHPAALVFPGWEMPLESAA